MVSSLKRCDLLTYCACFARRMYQEPDGDVGTGTTVAHTAVGDSRSCSISASLSAASERDMGGRAVLCMTPRLEVISLSAESVRARSHR